MISDREITSVPFSSDSWSNAASTYVPDIVSVIMAQLAMLASLCRFINVYLVKLLLDDEC